MLNENLRSLSGRHSLSNLNSWRGAELMNSLHPNNPHVWLVNVEPWFEQLEFLLSFLQNEEKKKANSFYRDVDKKLYIASHGILRLILSQYLECHPFSIIYSYSKYNKPYLIDEKFSNIFFNLSHSGGRALIGISAKHEIGVDVEFRSDEFDIHEVTHLFLNHEEIIECEEKEISPQDFWVCKEAILKAIGIGLSIDPRKIIISNLRGEKPSVEIPEDTLFNVIIFLKAIKISVSYSCAVVQVRNIGFKEDGFCVKVFKI